MSIVEVPQGRLRTPFTSRLEASFWAAGSGDPAIGAGNDSGSRDLVAESDLAYEVDPFRVADTQAVPRVGVANVMRRRAHRPFFTEVLAPLGLDALQQRLRLKEKDSWTDPVVAARGRFQLSDKWSATLFADYGSFVNDRKTYQGLVVFNYDFAESWSARFGYRYVKVKNDDEDFRFRQSGPVLGVSYKF